MSEMQPISIARTDGSTITTPGVDLGSWAATRVLFGNALALGWLDSDNVFSDEGFSCTHTPSGMSIANITGCLTLAEAIACAKALSERFPLRDCKKPYPHSRVDDRWIVESIIAEALAEES